MRKPAPTLATRVEELETTRELPLKAPETPPLPLPLPRNSASDRIKEVLLRWLEQEMM